MDALGRALPFTDRHGKFSFRALFSYAFDYAIIIVFAVAYAALDKLVTPFSQLFSLSDNTLKHPYAVKERIPIAEAVMISGGFPIVAIAIYTLVIDGLFSHSGQKGFKKYSFKQRLWELNCGILGLFLAQGAAFCITGTIKNLIGRPRPDLISRCIPNTETDPSPITLSSKLICKQTDAAIMQDGFRSFPSGHASSSFAGLGYLSLYLAGKLHVLDQRGEVWRTVIVLVPLLAASCIGASRIMDYRHHPTDVLIGSALGCLCAWAAYRQYFPPLGQTWMKGRAYPMREWGVSIRRPDVYYDNDYSSNRGDSTGNMMSRRNQPEELPYHRPYPTRDQEEHQMYNLSPMPANVRTDLPSPGFEPRRTSQSPGDEIDYEVIRPKSSTGAVQPMSGQQTGVTNVFREQVHRNQSQRRPGEVASDDEEDLGAGHRTLLSGPTRV